MTYIPSATKDFAEFTEAAAPALKGVIAHRQVDNESRPAAAPRRGIFRAIFEAIWTARQRQADAEIARYLAMSGGKLTDSAERDIARYLAGGDFRPR